MITDGAAGGRAAADGRDRQGAPVVRRRHRRGRCGGRPRPPPPPGVRASWTSVVGLVGIDGCEAGDHSVSRWLTGCWQAAGWVKGRQAAWIEVR